MRKFYLSKILFFVIEKPEFKFQVLSQSLVGKSEFWLRLLILSFGLPTTHPPKEHC